MYSTVMKYGKDSYNVTIEQIASKNTKSPRYNVNVYRDTGKALYEHIFNVKTSSNDIQAKSINESAKLFIRQAVQMGK